ncbi:MAG TPA: Asd/ArgC dimerization domain-containing protein [Terriglobia bacterium]|nr:Asd/ArgC dimerization domain-containing protein [Terriglobia bacterium]
MSTLEGAASLVEAPVARYRVAVLGASSLLGKELLAVVRERRFPVSRLVEIEASGTANQDPELPILDLDADPAEKFLNPEIHGDELDFAFIAAPPDPLPSFLRPEFARPAVVIDLEGSLAESGTVAPRIARGGEAASPAPTSAETLRPVIASAHPVTIALSVVLLRLASRFKLRSSVAHVLSPASELGPRAIEELQKQTLNLFSFQKVPQSVFGAQLAFNTLPRLAGVNSQALSGLENRVRGELHRYLAGRTPVPGLRFIQAPVFYSVALSLYVETAAIAAPAAVQQALAGGDVRMRRSADHAPSQVEVTGSDQILIDSVVADAGRKNGLWIWAAIDNLRLAAVNAVQIAEEIARRRAAAASERKAHSS